MQVLKSVQGEFTEWCASFREHDKWVVLDTETTDPGPKWKEGQVIDLAIVGSQGETLYNKLLKPTCPIGAKATAVHHITEAQVTFAPTWAEEWSKIEALLRGKLILTYNAQFDADMIVRSCKAHSIEMPEYEWGCIMRAYADFWKVPGPYGNYVWQKLENASIQQGLPAIGAHRALADTKMAHALLMKCGSDEQLFTSRGPYTRRVV